MIKLTSWNVNGLRACYSRGDFTNAFNALNADIFCLQETKMERGQAEIDFPGYGQYWNSAKKKGYSGTAIFTRIEPINVSYGIGIENHDQEGRVIRLEYEKFNLVNAYVPNSQDALQRLPYRMTWEDDFRGWLKKIEKDSGKPVVFCGDLNVAREDIDLKNPKTNRFNAGFTDEERNKMRELLNAGFCDTFRYYHPDVAGAYTWWSYMGKSREKNVGWRIDYFIVSESIIGNVIDASIYGEIRGSDHCPVGIGINFGK
jgi:exodeoxyribonuclease-3